MIDGLTRTASHVALAAAAAILLGAAAPAHAADLGGDCCADLEERVAELEATTTRHSNRHISMEFFGSVTTGILWYDNEEESDLYVVTDDNAGPSSLGFQGEGKLMAGWKVGYRVVLQLRTSHISEADHGDAEGDGDSIAIDKNFWYVESDRAGRLSVGRVGNAADGSHNVSLSGSTGIAGYHGPGDFIPFEVFDTASASYTGFSNQDFIDSFKLGATRDALRWDSATFNGFIASASWGEDDEWSLALRYANEWNGVAVAAAIGYTWSNDELCGGLDTTGAEPCESAGVTVLGDAGDDEALQASAAFYHASSGLFGEVGYVDRQAETTLFNIGPATDPAATGDDLQYASDFAAESLYIKLGWRKNVNGMGESGLYGEWNDVQTTLTLTDATAAASSRDVEATVWGFGLTQDFDSAGATFFVGYRHHQLDTLAVDAADADLHVDDGTITPSAVGTVHAGMSVAF